MVVQMANGCGVLGFRLYAAAMELAVSGATAASFNCHEDELPTEKADVRPRQSQQSQ